jgi:hypothetical protein
MEMFNPDSFVEEEDDIETLASEPIALVCYKDVQSFLQTLRHYLEQRSTDVMHLVKKLEKFEKEIDHLHVNQLQQTSIDVATLASSPLLTWLFFRLSKDYEC